MKKLFLILSIIFTILTFVGAGYVLANDSKVNAGYAAVPLLFTIVFIGAYTRIRKKK